MKKILTILLIISLFSGLSAKEDPQSIIKKAGDCFLTIAKYKYEHDDSTVYLANEGIKLCREIGDLKCEWYFHGTMTFYYIRHGRYKDAEDEIQIIKNIGEQLDDNDVRQFAYMNTGDIYSLKEMYVKALENYYNALNCYDVKNRSDFTMEDVYEYPELFKYGYDSRLNNIRVLVSIAYVMRTIGNTEENIKVLEEVRKDIDENGIEGLDLIMPKVVQEFGYSYALSGDEAKAEKSFLELIEMLKVRQWEDTYSMLFECYEGLGKIYIVQKRFDEAQVCIGFCKQCSDFLKNPHFEAQYHNLLGRMYREMGEYEKCIEECSIALNTDSMFYFTASASALNIARAYEHIGDNVLADKYFQILSRINIQNSSRNYQNSIAELNEKYESGLKDGKIAELTRIKHLNDVIIFSFSVIFVMIIFFVIIHYKINKRQNQLLAANSLIEGEINERKRISSDIHDRLIGNLVAVKNKVTQSVEVKSEINKMIDNCIEEVRDIAHNIMPPSLKYDLRSIFDDLASHYDKVTFHYYGNKTIIEERKKYCLFCIASELINNAERHSGATHIDLQLIENDELVSISVQDNGCGFDTDSTAEGFGLKNIRGRIEPHGGTLTIESEPGEGTEITVILKGHTNDQG